MLPSGPSPLYEAVKRDILQKIQLGVYKPDERLPSEHAMVEAYGVSRMTIHRALRELTSAGVLTRLQGVGTFVNQPRPQSALMEVRDIVGEIEARGHRHDAEVIALDARTAETAVARMLELPEGTCVFHSLILHSEDGTPVQLEERFVRTTFAKGYLDQDFAAGPSTYSYLLSCGPIDELEHALFAVQPSEDEQALLQLAPAEPCLLLRRRTWADEQAVTLSRLLYPGFRYSLASRYRPS